MIEKRDRDDCQEKPRNEVRFGGMEKLVQSNKQSMKKFSPQGSKTFLETKEGKDHCSCEDNCYFSRLVKLNTVAATEVQIYAGTITSNHVNISQGLIDCTHCTRMQVGQAIGWRNSSPNPLLVDFLGWCLSNWRISKANFDKQLSFWVTCDCTRMWLLLLSMANQRESKALGLELAPLPPHLVCHFCRKMHCTRELVFTRVM